jgi:acetoin utilization deacetylase AcuC-like enzyme
VHDLVPGHDARMLAHRSPAGHPERPARLEAVWAGLHEARAQGASLLPPREVTRAELERVHTGAYLDELERRFESGEGMLDADTFLSPGTALAARLAAGAAIDCTLAVWRGQARAGFAAVRPPGHHAEPARGMGFCLYNNIALAAAAARAEGCARVAIVDWDVHHGNGTQAAFYGDPDVLFCSLHQWPLYPGTGRTNEMGEGAGAGATINLPVPAGTGDAEVTALFDDVLLPRLHAFAPQLLLISAGYDAAAGDPLGGLRLTPAGYAALTRRLRRQAVGGRVVAILEGGYDLGNLERCTAATARALTEALA